ncbi:MAG TPA: transporter substrate-binding domain-containing protein [Candidatus Sulfotelmatobacter sp.]|nr:transporter substrate-binding domain-containing protein [Candidatus Sulfotelmatobacter sp.]
MRVRHLTLLLVLVLTIGYAGTAIAAGVSPALDRILAKKELVVGTAGSMPPLNMTMKDGTIAGMEPDLARLLAGSLNVKLTLKPIPFPDLLAALESGQVDMVLSGMTITPERNTRVAFAGPYFASGKSILTNIDSVAKTRSSDQINTPDTTLVALKNSTSQLFVERLMPKAKLVLADSYDDAVAMVLDKKVQAMVADYPICQVSAVRYRDKGLVTLQEPLSYEPIGVALPPNDPLLLNLVQNVINSLERGGELKMLADGWFSNGSWLKDLR